jgi:hypothetical protein
MHTLLIVLTLSFRFISYVNAPSTRVFLGAESREPVQLESDTGDVVDAAFVKQTGRLFLIARRGETYSVSIWSLTGSLVKSWTLPAFRKAIAELHDSGGLIRTILWDGKQLGGQIFLASMSPDGSSAPTVEELKDWSDYDKSLGTDRIPRVLRLMRILDFGVNGGAHADNLRANIGYFDVNARSLYNHLAWKEDYSVLAFSWDMVINTAVAVRSPLGNYRVEPMEAHIHRALGIPRESIERVDVPALAISSRTAAFGIRLPGRKPMQQVVLRFDLRMSPPMLIDKRDGILARPLERF